jgi:hypothetical protein
MFQLTPTNANALLDLQIERVKFIKEMIARHYDKPEIVTLLRSDLALAEHELSELEERIEAQKGGNGAN